MAEVKVTYETLFDLLRRERSRNELQPLEPSFYMDAVTYLREKNASLDSGSALSSKSEQEKIKIQIKNVKKILRELYEIREKKILNLAVNKARTNSELLDTSGLTPEEKVLFDKACLLLSESKHELIDMVVDAEVPTTYVPIKSVAPAKKDEEPQIKEQPKEERERVEQPSDALVQRIRMTSNLPKFMWSDKNAYGPFTSGDVAELPQKIAELLVRKGKAEAV